MSTIHELLSLQPSASTKQVDKAFIRKLQKFQARSDEQAAERLRDGYMKFLLSSNSNLKANPLKETELIEEIPVSKDQGMVTETSNKSDNIEGISESHKTEGHSARAVIEEEPDLVNESSKEEGSSAGKKVVGDVIIEDETPEPTRIPGNPNQKELILIKGESSMQKNESAAELKARNIEERKENYSQPKRTEQKSGEKNISNPTEQFYPKNQEKTRARTENPQYDRRPLTAWERNKERGQQEFKNPESKGLFSLLDEYFDYKNSRRNYLQEERKRLNQSLNNYSQTRGTSLLDLLKDTQRAQAEYFNRGSLRRGSENMDIEEENKNLNVPEESKNNGNFESYHISSHQHIIDNGKEKYMKSYSETSKNVNGKKESKIRSVQKDFSGENTLFEKSEGQDGNIQTNLSKIPEEEFLRLFGSIDDIGFKSLMC